MAFDPGTHLLYANNNSDIYEVGLVPRAQMERLVTIRRAKFLLICVAALALVLGAVMRRSFFPGEVALAIAVGLILVIGVQHLLHLKAARVAVGHINASRLDSRAPQTGAPYWMHIKPLSDRNGHPCAKLPWGALTALNLDNGKLVFRVPHGPDLDGQSTGSLSVSGPIVTAGGLIFSAGTRLPLLYVYDAESGARVAELPLPGPAQATPMAYELGGKEYVVIAAGGHGPLEIKQGDSVVAFTLPAVSR